MAVASVSGLRPAAQRTKANKDHQQASMLVSWLHTHDPTSKAAAEQDAQARGPKWRQYLEAGMAGMGKLP